MLLSLHAQATLGFVKDAAAGACYRKHYDDYCQLYEVRGSGLGVICISDFEKPSVSESTLEVDIEVLQDRLAKKKAEQALRAAPTTPKLSSAQEKVKDITSRIKADQALRAAPSTSSASGATEEKPTLIIRSFSKTQPSWPPRKPEASASDRGKGGQRTDSMRGKQPPLDPKPRKPLPQPPSSTAATRLNSDDFQRYHTLRNPSRRSTQRHQKGRKSSSPAMMTTSRRRTAKKAASPSIQGLQR